VRAPLEAALLPKCPGLKPTAKPRKSLGYELTLADSSAAMFKIHFGGYDRDLWAPIQVGVEFAGRTAPTRDAWRSRLEVALGRLPTGTRLENSGPTGFTLLTTFDWSTGDDLNEALVAKVNETLLQFASVLLPLLQPS
jgi:hypothetical protein